ncbi:MAG: pyridoxal phosphate-dependent aminotransferase [Myxococcota bacterium]
MVAAADASQLLDLTPSNPTAVGLTHDPEVYAALGNAGNARYQPCAWGLPEARDAVAEYYARRGRSVDPERVWICASTSEAYAQLLTLLADPGDAIVVPQPGYPLFDMLGDATGVRRVGHPLAFDGHWHLDASGLRAALAGEPRARAIVVVAPHNPTGHVPTPSEWETLQHAARQFDVPLLVDEVFADYPLGSAPSRIAIDDDDGGPCMVMSGLSKVAALPQLKLSWVVFHGRHPDLDELRRRAELLADAFLSVATPVQRALPSLLAAAEALQPRIRERLQHNRGQLEQAVSGTTIDALPATAGWTALLRFPAIGDLDDLGWARQLLEAGVLVQPGFLFDLPAPPRVAVSLLTPEPTFAAGIGRLVDHVQRVAD